MNDGAQSHSRSAEDASGSDTPFRRFEPIRWEKNPVPATAAEMREQDDRQRAVRAVLAESRHSSSTARKVGLIAVAGIAALVGGGYLLTYDPGRDPVVASCVRTDANGTQTVVADHECSSVGGGSGGRGWSSSGTQYHYYYGGDTMIGKAPSGGTTLRPRDVEIKTKSGTVIQRGGLGGRGGSGS
ncbi:hypothetical protein [Nocardia rhizosphaerae]|uniref:Uncharacterized protein n=1 Tax=Nocardia rhizosphaerae TaxID=1691571 RepID=A0ABV8L5E6_9NOCA